MAKQGHAGAGGVFWITFVVLGLAILIGIFYWMVKERSPMPHSPERPSGALWSEPVQVSSFGQNVLS